MMKSISSFRVTTLTLLLCAAAAWSAPPNWSRFAPEEAARRMDNAAGDLEREIRRFAAAVESDYRALAAETAGAYDLGFLSELSLAPAQEAEPPQEAEIADAAAPSGEDEGSGVEASLSQTVTPSVDMRSENRWAAVTAAYRRLGALLREQPPGGGTVAFTSVERYLLDVQGRVGNSVDELVGLHERVASDVSKLQDRDGIEAYLSRMGAAETAVTEATQTHLQFLLQEAISQWWLDILLDLEPEGWIEALRRQEHALSDGSPALAADLAAEAAALEAWLAHYREISLLAADVPAGLTVFRLLSPDHLFAAFSEVVRARPDSTDSSEPIEGGEPAGTTDLDEHRSRESVVAPEGTIGSDDADSEAAASRDAAAYGGAKRVVDALVALGIRGAGAPYTRNPVYRLSVDRLAGSLSQLSPGQRLEVSSRVLIDTRHLCIAHAVAAALMQTRSVDSQFAAAQSLSDMATEAFQETELSRRSRDVALSYSADGEVSVERLAAYLASDRSASDEQMQWSTLAVIENRHAQALIAGGSFPRVRDYLDSFVRRINEDVDATVARRLREDFRVAAAGAHLGAEPSPILRRLRGLFPASLRQTTPLFRLRELPLPPGWPLPFDRTVAVEAIVESGQGQVIRWVPAEIVAEYYSDAYAEATRSSASESERTRLRWMHMHGQSAAPELSVEGDALSDEWMSNLEDLLLSIANPWLSASEQAVDFVQQIDFRARAYIRLNAAVEAFVAPVLRSTRPQLSFGPEVTQALDILSEISAGSFSIAMAEAQLAGLFGVAAPGRDDFRPRVLVRAIVDSLTGDLTTRALVNKRRFQYARTIELLSILARLGAGTEEEQGLSYLRRVDIYESRDWIEATVAATARRLFFERITRREGSWDDE